METNECVCEPEPAIVAELEEAIEQMITRLRAQFRRTEAHQHAADYLRGLLADVERKNGWQLAECAGYAHPRGMQRVLDRYAWDADAVRDDLRRYVVEELGAPSGVLVVDETGFPKTGRQSVGVAPQYCGSVGKIANCQIGVFLGYASPHGHAGLDRALFLPQEWVADPARCEQAGVPAAISYRTKPQLARELLERALDAGVPAAWVVADAVYGSDGTLRRALEARAQAYVLAVRSNQSVTTWPPDQPPDQHRVAALAARLQPEDWVRLSCGDGAQGPRLYDWALVQLRPALQDGWGHALLVRRHPERTDELAYYRCYAPRTTALSDLVRAAGTRWTIEELFERAKGEVGLDHYEVRSWHGWQRHITLALVALAVLAVSAQKRGRPRVRSTSPSRSPKSDACSCGSSGRRRGHPTRSSPGLAGAAATRRSLPTAIAVAA